MTTTKIEKRIAKAQGLTDEQLEIMGQVDESEGIRNALREAAVADVLAELLESLKAGESLEDAIATIQENF
jgi:hypothetical protein